MILQSEGIAFSLRLSSSLNFISRQYDAGPEKYLLISVHYLRFIHYRHPFEDTIIAILSWIETTNGVITAIDLKYNL